MRRRKNIGRVLAGILAVGLLVSTMPSEVYATEDESGTAVVAEQETAVHESAETEPVGKEDNESEKETADSTDTTPEEEDKEDQEEIGGDLEQTEEDNEAREAEETETEVEADAEVTAAEMMEADEAEASGSCGYSLTWKYEDGVLTISGTGAMYDYQDYVSSAPWNIYQEVIECVVIEDSITTIGDYAFCDCSSLTSIELPSGVTTIGDCAFYGCCWLTNIELPPEVTAIGKSAFEECRSLTSIELPSGVTSIGDATFHDCICLKSIEFPSGITAIGVRAFSNCCSLASIELPIGITAIRVGAFGYCGSLTSIEVPSGVTTIEAYAFDSCSSLTSIELPSGVTAIGKFAFDGCSSLTSIEIPSGVTTIEADTFRGCSSLTSIELPSGVTTIDKYAFDGCSSLTSIEIPLGVTHIEEGAFYDCSSLASIEIPSGVTYIGVWAFGECSNLADIYYGGSESDWLSITICNYNEPLTTATIHYNSTDSGTGDKPKPPVKPDPDINDDPTLIVKQRTFKFTDPQEVQLLWGWNYILNQDSSRYIHDVSTVALALSAAAERSQGAIESMLEGDNFGVDASLTRTVNNDSSPYNPAFTFAYKAINNGRKTEHIIIIVGRGTSSFADGVTDYCSITDNFKISANNIWLKFAEWVNDKEIDGEKLTSIISHENVKFFVTGHSLGGAVANRIAYRLNQVYGSENVYAYTFASPPTEGQNATVAPNIFNVLCKGDIVPYLGAFTDGRYGNECWFEDSCSLSGANHLVQSYMRHLLNRQDKKFKDIIKSGGGWCPVDLRIYNSSGQLVGSVTDNAIDKENMTDSVIIVLSGENNDKKNFYFLVDDTYTIEFTGMGDGTLKYTIRDTYADKSRIVEKVFTNVTLTAGKEMTSSVSVWDKTDPSINIGDKIDTPQVQLLVLDEDGNAVKEVLPDGNGTEVPYTGPIEVLPEDIPADGKIPEGLWIAGVKDSYTYTGTAIKPEIRVYDGKTRLQPGKDYTAGYKNNIKVNNAAKASTAPTITVKGKGNYAGTETATFQITPVNLSDSVVLAEDITVAYNKKVQKKCRS